MKNSRMKFTDASELRETLRGSCVNLDFRVNYNPFHASSSILHAWGFGNFPDDGTVY